MILVLNQENLERIKLHASETYPDECCGALVGITNGNGDWEVKEVVRLQNRYDLETAVALGIDDNERGMRNRYIIDPKDLFQTEKAARAKSMSIVGFYHSHPDHPAAPSSYDLQMASEGYSYVIISVDPGGARDVTCWQTDSARNKFESVPLVQI